MDGDLLADILAIVWKVIRQFAIELDLSLGDKLQNQSGSELLGDRTEAKTGFRSIGNVPLHICQTETLFVYDFAVFSHEHRAIEEAVLIRHRHYFIDPCRFGRSG